MRSLLAASVLRIPVLGLLAMTAACAPSRYTLIRPESDRFASLEMRYTGNAEPWQHYHGIGSVDGHNFSQAIHSPVFVLEGRHVIGYLCPGLIAVDASPTQTFEFKAGMNYVLDCDRAAQIRPADSE
jgi:hypothetical protein